MVKKLTRLVMMGLLPMLVFGTNPKPENLTADSLFLLGEQTYAEEDYRLAIRYLDYLVLNYPTHTDIPTAQFHLAESFYNLKRFSEASVEYEFLYKQFPTSHFAEEAQIRAAECTFEISEPYYREQDLTLSARQMALEFLVRYPDSEFTPRARALLVKVEEKLARKELEAAKLYFQFKEYQAALMSLEYVISTFPQALSVRAETNYYLALSRTKLGEVSAARALLTELIDHPVWGEKAQRELNQLPEPTPEEARSPSEQQPELTPQE